MPPSLLKAGHRLADECLVSWFGRVVLPAATALVLGAACAGTNGVIVDHAREASTGSDGGAETIQAPDFEIELEPGQDPDEILDAADATVPAAPDDAIAVLCPAVQAVVAGTATRADIESITSAVPTDWTPLLADLADPVGRGADPAVAEVDRWFYATCSFPLFATVDRLADGCDDAACRADRIDDELGGLCVDDRGPEPDRYRLLSCVSGLPVAG